MYYIRIIAFHESRKTIMNTVVKRHILPVFSCLILFSAFVFQQGCSSTDHFITNRKYRKQVQKDFEARQTLAMQRQDVLFGVMTMPGVTRKEKEALEFLFAYMPLADLAEYTGGFYLDNVKHSFMVRETLPWGRDIPEDIFRHYVLPVRVNNESLDSSRWVFYPELKPRVNGLTLEQAALEVNRWCHEKVTYKATDGRTSSPLNTVKNAFGRCGEESVLTVAALRSVGIPARQVYVPRWAHSDDNHAWVEVWFDGKWHYMGACEPEPVLNRGWFTGPAKRAMLVHSRVFGNYQGDEEVITRERDYAVINSTAIYAEVTRPLVKVVDEDGKVVSNSKVEFGLYNYAEFYPVATLKTDNKGECSLTIGRGDILLHATDGTRCVWKKSNLRKDTVIFLGLKPCIAPGTPEKWHFDIPDEVPASFDGLPEELMNEHKRLLAREDSIRNTYVNTFPSKEEMIAFAGKINAPADSVVKYLTMSHGNYKNVMMFLQGAGSGHPDIIYKAFRFLSHLSEKDLRDADHKALNRVFKESPPMYGFIENPNRESNSDDIQMISSLIYSVIPYEYYTKKSCSDEFFNSYVYNPKIDLEVLKPHRIAIHDHFSERFGKYPEPQQIFNWIRDSITVDTTPLYSRILITPSGVHSLRVADPYSRIIYFVAACRSMGIPARLDPATKVPQALVKNEWKDFNFDINSGKEDATTGNLVINNPKSESSPEYYRNFTIAGLESGRFKTLEYPWGQALTAFSFPMQMRSGSYSLTSGLRQANGDIDVVRLYFDIENGKTTEISFPVPEPEKIVYGQWTEKLKPGMENGFIFLVLETTGEPSRHLLQEVQNTLASDPAEMLPVFIMWNEYDQEKTDALIHRYRLKKRVRVTETDQKIIQSLFTMMPESGIKLPLAAGINSDKEIVFMTGGYQINSISRIRELVLK